MISKQTQPPNHIRIFPHIAWRTIKIVQTGSWREGSPDFWFIQVGIQHSSCEFLSSSLKGRPQASYPSQRASPRHDADELANLQAKVGSLCSKVCVLFITVSFCQTLTQDGEIKTLQAMLSDARKENAQLSAEETELRRQDQICKKIMEEQSLRLKTAESVKSVIGDKVQRMTDEIKELHGRMAEQQQSYE